MVGRAVAAGAVPGAAWRVERGGEVARGAAGTHTPGGDDPVPADAVFRISSVTEPVVATAALGLVDDGALALDEPVDRLLPELAGRQVLADPADAAAGTVPARRAITVRDLLTSRPGLGLDSTAPWPTPTVTALGEAGLPAGPPAPQAAPPPDEWLRRLSGVPLAYQPGEHWLHHVGARVPGVLVARAAGRPLPEVLAERVVDPLGMADTGFGVPGPRAAVSARTGCRRTTVAAASRTTPPTASGHVRRPSPTVATAWSPPSTTSPSSRGPSSPAAAPPTGAGSSGRRPSGPC